MLFKLTHPLPEKVLVAVSGGPDSVAAFHWLWSPRHDRVAGIVHVNHGPPDPNGFPDSAEKLVKAIGDYADVPVYIRKLQKYPGTGSKEAWWRDQRYEYFKEISSKNEYIPVVLGHTFNDCLEEYLMCVLVRGYQGTIPYAHDPCIRPFRLWKRESVLEYLDHHNILYRDDPTNLDIGYKRNYIRHMLVQHVLYLNPGIWNLVKRCMHKQDLLGLPLSPQVVPEGALKGTDLSEIVL